MNNNSTLLFGLLLSATILAGCNDTGQSDPNDTALNTDGNSTDNSDSNTALMTDTNDAVDPYDTDFSADIDSAIEGVFGLMLVDADSNQDIRYLGAQDTINLAVIGSALSIRADTSATVLSVTFGVDDNDNFQTEETAPFTLAGDSNGDYKPWTPLTGTYTITATPDTGAAMTINLKVIDSSIIEPAPADTAPLDTDIPNGTTGVYIEVESITPVSPWVEETVHADYSGTSYFRWPDIATNENGITGDQNAVLEYPFAIGTSGTYLFEIRGRRDHEGWCADAENDACNDLWVQIDNESWSKKMIKEGTWDAWIWDPRWEPSGKVIITEVPLNAGRHTYRISGRSNGVKIDAIRIYRDGTTPPDA